MCLYTCVSEFAEDEVTIKGQKMGLDDGESTEMELFGQCFLHQPEFTELWAGVKASEQHQ